ncbi:hypothetical protein M413DRAFT_445819 [Hebeloma cylindrosporum]|uniref:Uncharacterized protein n=1 Tax=Hebeloma cylindrosporum TaxID=76867 RepID=A0A0C3CA70_HEBCY|nr:hypothetical protein M413DRAFT_445819 [Hebeloma cylindrosporum h7]
MSSSRSSSPALNVDFSDPAAAAAAFAQVSRRYEASQEKLAEATKTRRKRAPTSTPEELVLQRARDRTFASYNILLRLVPQIKTALLDPDTKVYTAFVSDLQDGANGARGEDIGRINNLVATWVNDEYKPSVPLKPAFRDGRGIQHDVCGELLCPIKFDWRDPEVRANVRSNKEGFTIRNKYFITCLYVKGRADPNDPDLFFLRSRLLLQAYCSIFTSPSSAEGFEEETEDGPARKKQRSSRQRKATKSNVASLLNMDGKVTPRSIAYVAVLLVFNLTNAASWTETHNGFNFMAFYNFIIDYFEVTCDEYEKENVEQLLAWWNRQVFPHHVVDDVDSRESYDELAAARARARAACQAA